MKEPEESYTYTTESKDPTPLLDCPQCHSFISAEGVNTKKNLAKCSHCNHIFNYEAAHYWDPFGPPLETHPDGIEVLRLQTLLDLRISHRHSASKFGTVFTMGFAFLWNLLLLPFIFVILSSGQWHILLFISLHLFAGVSMIWRVLGQLFNQTTIEVNRDRLSTKTWPFVWFGERARTIPTNQIRQLFVNRTKSKNGQAGPTYSLHVLLKSGKKMKLLAGLNERTLLYLESQIEDYLQIENRPVTS